MQINLSFVAQTEFKALFKLLWILFRRDILRREHKTPYEQNACAQYAPVTFIQILTNHLQSSVMSEHTRFFGNHIWGEPPDGWTVDYRLWMRLCKLLSVLVWFVIRFQVFSFGNNVPLRIWKESKYRTITELITERRITLDKVRGRGGRGGQRAAGIHLFKKCLWNKTAKPP